jgi:predicted dehydrogenase
MPFGTAASAGPCISSFSSWRYERARAGAGALLDVGPHAIDAARFLCGEIVSIQGASESISIAERYVPAEASAGHGHVKLTDKALLVDNDDMVSALLQFESGCQGLFSVSRVASGFGNTLSFVVVGTEGTIRFTSERPGEYQIARREEGAFFITVPNRSASPFAGLMPVPHDGVAIGYGESFSYMIAEFIAAIAEGRPTTNGTIEDGLKVVLALEAIGESLTSNRPAAVPA